MCLFMVFIPTYQTCQQENLENEFPRNLIRTSRQCPFFPYCIQVINRQGNNFSSKDETIHSQNGHLHGFEQQPLPSSLLPAYLIGSQLPGLETRTQPIETTLLCFFLVFQEIASTPPRMNPSSTCKHQSDSMSIPKSPIHRLLLLPSSGIPQRLNLLREVLIVTPLGHVSGLEHILCLSIHYLV